MRLICKYFRRQVHKHRWLPTHTKMIIFLFNHMMRIEYLENNVTTGKVESIRGRGRVLDKLVEGGKQPT